MAAITRCGIADFRLKRCGASSAKLKRCAQACCGLPASFQYVISFTITSGCCLMTGHEAEFRDIAIFYSGLLPWVGSYYEATIGTMTYREWPVGLHCGDAGFEDFPRWLKLYMLCEPTRYLRIQGQWVRGDGTGWRDAFGYSGYGTELSGCESGVTFPNQVTPPSTGQCSAGYDGNITLTTA